MSFLFVMTCFDFMSTISLMSIFYSCSLAEPRFSFGLVRLQF